MHANVPVLAALILLQAACSRAPSPATLQDEVNPTGADAALNVTIHGPHSRILPTDPNAVSVVNAWCLKGPACPAANVLFSIPTSSATPDAASAQHAPLALTSSFAVSMSYSNGVRLDLDFGSVNDALTNVDVALGRIDVNHMTVSRPDGSSYSAKGTAIVSRVDDAAKEVAIATIATGYGLDVPNHARYKIVVNVFAEDGPKSTTSFLDL